MICATLKNPGFPNIPVHLESIYWEENDGCSIYRTLPSKWTKPGNVKCTSCGCADRGSRKGGNFPLVCFKVLESKHHKYGSIFHYSCIPHLQRMDSRSYLWAALAVATSTKPYVLADHSRLLIKPLLWGRGYDDTVKNFSRFACINCRTELASVEVDVSKSGNPNWDGNRKLCLTCVSRHPYLRDRLDPERFQEVTNGWDITVQQKKILARVSIGVFLAEPAKAPPKRSQFHPEDYYPCRFKPDLIKMNGRMIYEAESSEETMRQIGQEILEYLEASRGTRIWVNKIREAPPIGGTERLDLDKLFPSHNPDGEDYTPI